KRPMEPQLSKMLEHLVLSDPREIVWAARLGFSVRALQRHFASRGFSYRRLLDLLRANVAVMGLTGGEGQPLLDLAHTIGFREQSTLSRAMRRWTGRSPREICSLFGMDFAKLRV